MACEGYQTSTPFPIYALVSSDPTKLFSLELSPNQALSRAEDQG